MALNTNRSRGPERSLFPFSLLYIAATFSVGLAINVWIFYRVTGGLFNPAITLGLYLIGVLGPIRAILVLIAQFMAGIAAAAVADGLVPPWPLPTS
ncbi:hypothetical protein ACRE_077630 [Hapsidospora chrysogenum ATCC 11550]|uniref:Aquaporin-like protein n=1 Tax=Hapsidospora chrysogenum (strain ATCC 11550 / CBS 779.69 / DSM 880 / IAM 14645 / JCM 23072 / IMI 49137) TaxID=857340 RepID=A0A086SWN2_HAPC1|nr:hypothetical protein ACRE_077630 [Hapsidospora chrysogenum ATCC 11550]